MSTERESELRIYSLGIVVEDKARNSDYIKVTPIEVLTLTNEKLNDAKNQYIVELPDVKNIKRSSQVESELKLIAKWIPYGESNRITAPDVIKNETVLIFRFADTDQYYWTDILREPKLRRLETVLYAYCNIPTGLEAFDKETSYWLEWSTHDKYVQLHTSKNDSEPFTYDLTFNTAKGFYLVTDDVGNFFQIDSTNTTNTLQNASKTYYKQEEERIYEFSIEFKYTESEKIFRYGREYICDRSPIIYLNSPEIIMGEGECGADITSTAYHDVPFVHVSKSMAHARIGNAWESYSHYDGQDQTNFCKESLSDECNNRSTNATSSIQETTQTRSIKASTISDETSEHLLKTDNKTETVNQNKKVDVGQDYELNVDRFMNIKAKDQITIESDCLTRINGRVEIDMSFVDQLQHSYPQSTTPFDTDWENHSDKDELHLILQDFANKLTFLEAKRVEMADKLSAAEAQIAEQAQKIIDLQNAP